MTRDERFVSFAHLLLKEMLELRGGWIDFSEWDKEDIEEYSRIIAHRAYDLVKHAVGYSLECLDECGKEISGSMGTRVLATIPDLTKWSKEQ